jgi:hypothetical protein
VGVDQPPAIEAAERDPVDEVEGPVQPPHESDQTGIEQPVPHLDQPVGTAQPGPGGCAGGPRLRRHRLDAVEAGGGPGRVEQ